MKQLVLVRHGQSEWNLENRFTGWVDVDLSARGREEATEGGRRLAAEGFTFDVAYTSLLKRAIRTLWRALDAMDLLWLPVIKDWRLNERHYGKLTGLNKSETAARHGEEQVLVWRRSFDTPPPAFDEGDPENPSTDRRYEGLPPAARPLTECLKDTVARIVPFWEEEIAPRMRAGERVIVAARGNSLRALVMHLEGMTPDEVLGFNIPTGIPLVIELGDDLSFQGRRYLASDDELAAATAAVANQGRAGS